MIKIRNTGTLALTVTPPGGDPIAIPAGGEVDVPDAIAEFLCADPRGHIEMAPAKKTTKKPIADEESAS